VNQKALFLRYKVNTVLIDSFYLSSKLPWIMRRIVWRYAMIWSVTYFCMRAAKLEVPGSIPGITRFSEY
jgi:hypothetical protein